MYDRRLVRSYSVGYTYVHCTRDDTNRSHGVGGLFNLRAPSGVSHATVVLTELIHRLKNLPTFYYIEVERLSSLIPACRYTLRSVFNASLRAIPLG